MTRSKPPGPRARAAVLGLALAGVAGLVGCGVPPEAPAAGPPAVEEADEAAVAVSAAMIGDPDAGEANFTLCASCHGPNGVGIPNLGKNLHNNAFLAEMSDDEAVAFLVAGRPANDPLNTTGVAMPPKGGNPAFSDQDLYDIVAYVRTLK